MPLPEPPPRNYDRKPLVEAICEIRWQLSMAGPPAAFNQGGQLVVHPPDDPHFLTMANAIQAKLAHQYPVVDQLLPDAVPTFTTPYQVRRRFRAVAGQWPVVQIGPGVLTTNETASYAWPTFRERTLAAYRSMRGSHPKPVEQVVDSLMLRYIDALPVECMTGTLASVLNDKLRIQATLPSDLFTDTGVSQDPIGFRYQSVHASEAPKGVITITIFLGSVNGERRVLWETVVHSAGQDVPALPDGLGPWLDDAHRLTRLWFDRMTDRIKDIFL